MKDESYYRLQEEIIEASFYLTKAIGREEFLKADNYRRELNKLVDMALKNNVQK